MLIKIILLYFILLFFIILFYIILYFTFIIFILTIIFIFIFINLIIKIFYIIVFYNSKVIEYCEYHRNDPAEVDEELDDISRSNTGIGNWDMKFLEVNMIYFKI